MSATKDYAKVVAEQEANLNRIKEEFDRQSAQLETMLAQAEALGLDLEKRPDLGAMSEEERQYCLEFERQLLEVNRLLTQGQPERSKPPRLSRRRMI